MDGAAGGGIIHVIVTVVIISIGADIYMCCPRHAIAIGRQHVIVSCQVRPCTSVDMYLTRSVQCSVHVCMGVNNSLCVCTCLGLSIIPTLHIPFLTRITPYTHYTYTVIPTRTHSINRSLVCFYRSSFPLSHRANAIGLGRRSRLLTYIVPIRYLVVFT
ncbi:hypothetical protein F5X99DRAFT_319428 [Biscogniauxia marginata]|nr:hypothetical protein F5X99DRAFT_319428 [Biscogniauxia marginata]